VGSLVSGSTHRGPRTERETDARREAGANADLSARQRHAFGPRLCSRIVTYRERVRLSTPRFRTTLLRMTSGSMLGLHELDVESNGDLVTDQNATCLECSVPRQAEILAVDLCARGDRNSGVAPGILRRWSWPFNRKADFARQPPNSQVAFHRQFSLAHDADARRLEVQDRKLLHMKEIGAL